MNSLIQPSAVPTAAPSQAERKSRKRHLRTAIDSGDGSDISLSLTQIPETIASSVQHTGTQCKTRTVKVSINMHTFTVNFPRSVLLVHAILELPSCALESTCSETLMPELISCDSE